MSILGNRIKKEREYLELTREELAKKLDVSYSAISMYERGEREPDNDKLTKLAEIFNCSTDYLLGKSDIRNIEELKQARFANYGGVDTEGLDEEDLKELQRHIEYMKKIKKNK